MHTDKKTSLDTLGTPGMEFRSDDWYYLPLWPEDLIDGMTLDGELRGPSVMSSMSSNMSPDNFDYGKAASSPHNLHDHKNGGPDICHPSG